MRAAWIGRLDAMSRYVTFSDGVKVIVSFALGNRRGGKAEWQNGGKVERQKGFAFE